MIRLLHIDTLEFAEFHRNPPPYAVTSHRWRDSEEVSLRDVTERRDQIEGKSGFRKILGFCSALKRMLQLSPRCTPISWLWIDTCCIDKANFTELSEAITSMYRWYSRAKICLAFLQDVVGLDQPPLVVMDSFQRSEWHRRGWTLQELLAPKNVVFFNKRWEVLGHKSSSTGNAFSMSAVGLPLNQWITMCTSISTTVLGDFNAADLLPVSEKQSWMEGRTTTRPEDMAYCQLGIFGVFMPLIYGEEDHAMIRLADAIHQKVQRSRQASENSAASSGSKSSQTFGPLTMSPRGSYYESLSSSVEPWIDSRDAAAPKPKECRTLDSENTDRASQNAGEQPATADITEARYDLIPASHHGSGRGDRDSLVPALNSLSISD